MNALVMVPNKAWSLVIPPGQPEDFNNQPYYTHYAIVLDPQDGWVNTVGTQFSVGDVAARIAVGWRVAEVSY